MYWSRCALFRISAAGLVSVWNCGLCTRPAMCIAWHCQPAVCIASFHTKSCQMLSGVVRMRSTDQALQTMRSRQDLVRMKSRCLSQGDMNSLGYSKDALGQSIAVRKLCVVMQDFAQQGIKLLYYGMNCLSLQQLNSFPCIKCSIQKKFILSQY